MSGGIKAGDTSIVGLGGQILSHGGSLARRTGKVYPEISNLAATASSKFDFDGVVDTSVKGKGRVVICPLMDKSGHLQIGIFGPSGTASFFDNFRPEQLPGWDFKRFAVDSYYWIVKDESQYELLGLNNRPCMVGFSRDRPRVEPPWKASALRSFLTSWKTRRALTAFDSRKQKGESLQARHRKRIRMTCCRTKRIDPLNAQRRSDLFHPSHSPTLNPFP